MPSGFHAMQQVEYMKENGIKREQIATMPCRIKGIKPGVLQRLSQGGIIKRKSRTNDGTIWMEGCHHRAALEAWK